jgi:hypothetical protein
MKAFTVKAWLGGVGFIVGLAGIALEIDWIVWIGVGLLAAAFLLRFVKEKSPEPPTLLLGFLFVIALPAAAQEPAPLRVARVSEAVRLDGIPDEPVWLTTDSITDFTQQEPAEGRPATERTVVRVLATPRGLFVGLWAYDGRPHAIRHAQLRRDAQFESDDSFSILLDPLYDHRSGLVFTINPNGALGDAEVASFEGDNEEWDGVWDARARIAPSGWTAEVLIPWQTLRYRADAPRWGVNFRRVIRRTNERVLWRAWRRTEGLLYMPAEGTLDGLRDLPSRSTAELRPYAAATGSMRELAYRSDGSDSIAAFGDGTAKVGLDAKVALTGALTLDLTANTDFAQVDVDRQVVNLTRFPLFFPEKRPFFLELGSLFDFGRVGQQQLFYSRRIGLAPDGTTIPLVAGARFTGRVGRQQVGVLAVRTGGVEDAWDFVGRARRDVLANGFVGAMLTSQSRPGQRGPSLAGGVDFNLPLLVHGQNLVLLGFASAQRDSAGAPVGGAARFGIDYPNDRWDNFVGFNVTRAAYAPALGFVRETDVMRQTGHIDYFPRPRFWGIRRLHFTFLEWDVTTRLDGTRSHASFAVSPLGGELHSGDEFALTLQRFEDVPDAPFEIFPGDTVAAGHYWWNRAELGIESSAGRPVGFDLTASLGDFYTGTGTEVVTRITVRTAPHLITNLEFEQQNVRLATGRFIARTTRLRLDAAASPRLSSTLFVQHDNESDRLRLNVRLHWIPSLGSDFYVVWNSAWPTGLSSGIPWRGPQRGQLTGKLVYYFRP